jgi:hypothetical protein
VWPNWQQWLLRIRSHLKLQLSSYFYLTIRPLIAKTSSKPSWLCPLLVHLWFVYILPGPLIWLIKWMLETMQIWQNANLTKCRCDKMPIWQNANLSKCQFVKMPIWQITNLTKCQIDKMPIWESDLLTKCQNDQFKNDQSTKKLIKWLVEKMTSWQNEQLTKWLVEKMTLHDDKFLLN